MGKLPTLGEAKLEIENEGYDLEKVSAFADLVVWINHPIQLITTFQPLIYGWLGSVSQFGIIVLRKKSNVKHATFIPFEQIKSIELGVDLSLDSDAPPT